MAALRSLPPLKSSIAFTTICLFASSAQADKALRWKFNEGETIRQRMVQEMEMTMEGGPVKAAKTEMTQTVDMSWKVETVGEGGVAEITQSIDRIKMEMSVAGGAVKMSIDTAKDEEYEGPAAQMAPVLKKLTEARFTVEMNAKGEVLEVTVPKEVTEAFKGLGPAGQMFNKDWLERMVRDASPTFPEDEVSEGETWKRKYSMKMQPIGSMDVVQTMKYQGVEEVKGQPLEKIGVELELGFDAAETPAGATIKLGDQSASGTIYFDNARGRISHSDIKQKMVMEISLAGQQIKQNIQQNVSVQFLYGNDTPDDEP